ncbi:MAG: DUF4260 domain-containing protein [Sandaracinus sp.]|nr:DUF4260 domain-containing protein [Sandaracinus sp.]MCB9617104.1 DUF4260 domain-containing protein [Sandaracinus sp.]
MTTQTTAFDRPFAPSSHTTVEAPSERDTTHVGVHGGPRLLLRLEGALVLALAVATYVSLGGSWGWLAALFFAPDVVLLGYLVSPRVGAAFYNAGHSYLGPALVAGIAFAFGAPTWALLGALIWVGHIGFDRMLGYGLKHATSFFDTHLGRVGKR